jgi:hypothetical protein
MTRDSKREIERALDELEDDDPSTLGGDEMWNWIEELQSRGTDTPRPPAYFPDGTEWADGLKQWQETAAERYPELTHLTPPEAYVLSYLDEETIQTLLKLLATCSDPAVEQWRHEAMSNTEAEA